MGCQLHHLLCRKQVKVAVGLGKVNSCSWAGAGGQRVWKEPRGLRGVRLGTQPRISVYLLACLDFGQKHLTPLSFQLIEMGLVRQVTKERHCWPLSSSEALQPPPLPWALGSAHVLALAPLQLRTVTIASSSQPSCVRGPLSPHTLWCQNPG